MYVHNACERREAEEYLQILVFYVSRSNIRSYDNQQLFENGSKLFALTPLAHNDRSEKDW